VIERGFTGQSWLTFRQALSLGGHVRKGERGTTVVYADRFVPNGESDAPRDRRGGAGNPVPETLHVFNTDQCEELPDEIATAAPPRAGLIEPTVEALIKASGIRSASAEIAHSMHRPKTMCRSRLRRPIFEPINWHRTALHELAHATGIARA